jgi:hypothetical protein
LLCEFALKCVVLEGLEVVWKLKICWGWCSFCSLGGKETSCLRSWSAELHDICRFLPVLCFIHSSYLRDADCQVRIRQCKLMLCFVVLFSYAHWISSSCCCLFFWGFRNDGMEDRYSILIRFDSQESTDNFYKHFNGRRFSSLEVWCAFNKCCIFYWVGDLYIIVSK